MNEQIDIWLVGNTGLRNPNRIQDGFKVFAGSPYVGNLHGKENEIGFMNYLNEKGIIQNEDGKDESGSHARKWRLMFAKNGFIYPQVKKKDEIQEDLGLLDDITPFGRSFLKADTYPAVQECYLRAMSVEQFALPDGIHYFSPLRWLLAIMLELEKRTGTSELSRIEFALWGHTTNPSYNLSEVVDSILDLRKRRAAAPAKRPFDKKEIAERGKNYDKKADNFLDYSDMNMRYLRISGVLQRKGRGLIIVPTKHVLAEQLAKSTASDTPITEQYKLLCNGAPLPTDNVEVAKSLLDDLIKQTKERHIFTVTGIDVAFFNSGVWIKAAPRFEVGMSLKECVGIFIETELAHRAPQELSPLDQLIQYIARPVYERVPGNDNVKTFDRIRMTVGLPRYQFNSWEALQSEVKKYQHEIYQRVIQRMETNRSFKRYGVPINFLEISNVTLLRDFSLEFIFELKEPKTD